MGIVINGQLAAAVAVLVDAIFGVLIALGTIHTKPDQSLIVAVVTVTFNAAAYVLAIIQHQTNIVKLNLQVSREQLGLAKPK